MNMISLIGDQNVKFSKVLISHWKCIRVSEQFKKIKRIHKQIHSFACDCSNILSQGVQISTTSQICIRYSESIKVTPGIVVFTIQHEPYGN